MIGERILDADSMQQAAARAVGDAAVRARNARTAATPFCINPTNVASAPDERVVVLPYFSKPAQLREAMHISDEWVAHQ